MDAVLYLSHLRKACARAGVGHTTYCVLALIASGRARTVPGLAMHLGLTQKGVKDASIRRAAHLFHVDPSTSPATYTLSQEGINMLAAVKRFMPSSPAEKPAKPRRCRPISPRTQLLLDL